MTGLFPAEHPEPLPPSPSVRLSVLPCLTDGPSNLRICDLSDFPAPSPGKGFRQVMGVPLWGQPLSCVAFVKGAKGVARGMLPEGQVSLSGAFSWDQQPAKAQDLSSPAGIHLC